METVYVFTSDRRNWLLRGFAWQWQKYAPTVAVVVVGFTPPEFDLPGSFQFQSLGDMADYPVNKWSDAIIRFLEACPEKYLPIFLEDYWLIRPVHPRVLGCARTVAMREGALRVDLTTDRLYCGAEIRDCESVSIFDFFESAFSPYQVSLQASIWDRDKLLTLLIPGETPWQFEINGNQRLLDHPGYRVYGNRQWMFKYQIMVNKGELALDGSWMYPPRQLRESDLDDLRFSGCLPVQESAL